MPALRRHLPALILASLVGALHAQTPDAPAAPTRPFAGPPSDGFFYYRDPRITPTPSPEEPPPETAAAPTPEPQPSAPPATPAPTPGPPEFSTAWIRENLPRYLDRAIDDPTPENVRAYMALQRVSLDKAERFSEVSQQVVIGESMLDESFRRPLNSFGALEQTRVADSLRASVFASLKDEVGVFYFYRADCGYCVRQGPILKSLADEFGFRVTAVSMDGQPPPSGDFPGYLLNEGQAEALGVQSTPAIFLARPSTGEITPISQGMLSLSDLIDRTLLVSHRNGWISDEQYESTRAVDDTGPSSDSEEYWRRMRTLMSLPALESTPLTPSPLQASAPAPGASP